MKLKKLIDSVKSTLIKKMNIKHSISILNIPKQNFLDKGDLIMLLDENNELISMEWFKLDQYHVELITENNENNNNIINTILKNKNKQLFETVNFDINFDSDFFIEYMDLDIQIKKNIKLLISDAESVFKQRYNRFGNGIDKKLWLRNIQLQNGNFTEWCKESKFSSDKIKCIKEAYKISDETNDYLLKKRASFAKCFIKITDKKSTST